MLAIAIGALCSCGRLGFEPRLSEPVDGGALLDSAAPDGGTRVSDDLIALYLFDGADPEQVADVSDFGAPLDLAIDGTGFVSSTPVGVAINGETLFRSLGPASKIVDACQATNAITMEVWVRPALVAQGGPARIATLSHGVQERNIGLLQGGFTVEPFPFWHVRLRTENSGVPGVQAVNEESLDDALWTHLVFTRAADDRHALYINGTPTSMITDLGTLEPPDFSGAFDNWDRDYHLHVGNEFYAGDPDGQDRFWLGEIALLAIYRRALGADEVLQNLVAGRSAGR